MPVVTGRAARLFQLLAQMQHECDCALKFAPRNGREDFLDTLKDQYAAGMALIQIGEIAAIIERKFPDFILNHSQWPWREIKSMRNIMAHDYGSADQEMIWDTIQNDIPMLQKLLDDEVY